MASSSIVLQLAVACALPAALAAQTLAPTTDARIDSMARALVGTRTPGLAVAVVHRGEVVHARGYGTADVDAGTRFTLQTPTYVASVAKMFTASAVLQQVEQGKLQLNAQLGELLPETPHYARALTIGQLLTHTSGLADHLDIGGTDRSYSYDDVIGLLTQADSLLFPPETRSAYSNAAYVLLARVLERVSGMRYDEYLRTRFFEPTGMAATVVTDSAHLPGNRARGYRPGDQPFSSFDYHVSATTGAGGIYASVQDLYSWIMALRAGRILKPETLRLASTPAVRSNGRLTPWGMGWLAESHGDREPLRGKTYVAAVGQLRGFQTLVKWYQEEDLIIIWTANAASPDVFDGMHGIAQMLLL